MVADLVEVLEAALVGGQFSLEGYVTLELPLDPAEVPVGLVGGRPELVLHPGPEVVRVPQERLAGENKHFFQEKRTQ